jgi:hypothetical protein
MPSNGLWPRIAGLFLLLCLLAALPASCLNRAGEATPTPTRTPRSAVRATSTPAAVAQAVIPDLPTATPVPSVTPTYTPSPTDVPATATASPSPLPPTPTRLPPTQVAVAVATQPPPPPTQPPAPASDFVIADLHVLGLGQNNGGIEGPGAGRTIFITVLDAAGNPLNGALVVNTAQWPRQALSGDKGPGKAEILMDREEFRLKVQSVNGQPVTSETSHTMSLIAPVPSDIAGKLGSACPTTDNCPLPPYKHFSYVITFRRTH